MKNQILVRFALIFVACAAAFLATMTVLAATVSVADDEVDPGVAYLTAPAHTVNVRCDHGQSLARAVTRSRPNQIIKVSGTCHEIIVVRTDRLTITGVNGAVLDGGGINAEAVVTIDGARGVTLRELSVANGSDQGVLVTRQAFAILHNLNLIDHGTVGLSVDRSQVEIHDLDVTDNGTGGIDAYTGSIVLSTGTLNATGNGGDGIAINGKSFLELRGATVVASNNLGSGVSVINDSRLQIFSFPEAQGSTITADSNGFAGIGLLGAQLGVVGSQYFGSGANVLTVTNNAIGFFMPAGAILSPHATARFVAKFNGAGMIAEDNAQALIIGGLEITNNGVGISAVGAGTLTLVSVPPNPSVVQLNQLDMELGFGTRATLDGIVIDALVCDASTLVRGSVSCP